MPDPLLSSSEKRLMSIRIIANEENSIAFLNFCYGYYSISKNQFIRPPGRSPCGEKFFEDRKKLNSGFLRSFLVFKEMAAGLFWLYRRVKKGKPYVKTENQDPVRKGRNIVAAHLSCLQINLIDCHRMNRYNDISLKKEKAPGHLLLR